MEEKREDNSTLYTLLFAGLMVLGAIGGTSLAVRLVPDSQIVAVAGLLMLPLGAILGVSFAQKTMPPNALLNLMSVFDGRHTIAEMMAKNGAGGAMSLAIGAALGSVVVAIGMAFFLDVFVKPEMPFSELAKYFGGAGLAFGVISGAALFFMTE